MVAFGDGLAQGPDLLEAARTAATAATAPLVGERPDLVTVFVCHPDPDVAAAAGTAAMEAAGGRVSLGCSAGGVIGSARGVEAAPSVAVWAASLPAAARVTPYRLDTARAGGGLTVGGMPRRQGDDAVAVLLADPFTFPVQGFVEQAPTALDGLPLIGGLASGAAEAGGTRLFLDGRVHERGAVGVVLGGDVALRTLVSQGCRPIGPTMTVTAADGPHLRELAGVPAYRKLEEIVRALDPAEREMVAHGLHLGVAMDEYADQHERGDFLVRGVVGADPDAGTVTVGDVVEVGRTVRFQARDAATATEDLDALMSAHLSGGTPGGALLFSCNGRGTAMFDAAAGGPDHDVRALRRGLRTPAVGGFFAGGEIGPVAGRTHLHSFTASVLTFGT